jgi:hypothetical protein
MLDVIDKVHAHFHMIAWWWSPLSKVTEGVTFIDLIDFGVNGNLPPLVAVGMINCESIFAVLWNKNAEFAGRSVRGSMELGLFDHASELDFARGDAFE